ncbi:YcaO-like family protein [Vibrio spartinae]|uniref:Methanogenesis marker protein 1 n=2 Tax=Vibrio spartinae TaxID=1918945 RepID=A0A1N6M6W6_9VIBR|nr:YcaO-like family protein [Vibrio spartinae]QMV13919.1 putative methanogenesis marker protein 1 [Vibrio spartinae]SIO95183.1 YcaO-like family protein [Vibrio spartinae]
MACKAHQKGTHRSCSPQSTFNNISPWLSSMGITRIANITGLDNIGIPVVTVCRPESCAISVAQGKGLDVISAKVSGAMEAIETYHAENIDLPLRLSNLAQLSENHHVIDVDRLPKLSFSHFSSHNQLLWIEGEELFTQQAIHIPYEVVHCNYTLPLPTGSGAFIMSSNGLASGNTLDEAIVHGLCEVIERDALTLWRLEQKYADSPIARQLNLDTIDDSDCLSILAKYREAGVYIQVWDITSDIELPSFFCRIISENATTSPRYPAFGSGTHPCKSIALLRALTEAAQTRLTLISGSRDDIKANDYHSRGEESTAVRSAESYAGPLRNFADIPSWSHQRFDDDIKLVLGKLRQVGITQVGVVNLEKNQYKIPVARVVVPGLEGIDETTGYIPGQRATSLIASLTRKEEWL